MKRFHVHIAVASLDENIDFYTKLFGQPPSKQRDDYAKWMLEDPRVNFAISARGQSTGVDHFGIQVDTAEELTAIKQLAETASPGQVFDQGEATCCYANSEKHWTTDPQGLAWENFQTLSEASEFGDDSVEQSGACCIPVHGSQRDSSSDGQSCCIANESSASDEVCCG